MELQHFSHHHPLIFHEDRENNYRVFSNICYGSRKRVSGPNYSCKECFEFVLHKSCVELPRELRHPLHPEHPLLLTKDHHFSEGKCEGCNRDYLEPGFNYHCFDCNFDLDRNCASLPLTIQPESHAHPLTLMQRSVSFTCDACGKKGKGKGMFYTCVACAFWVHLQCASFPLIVKHIRNTHSLNLTNSLQVPQSYHRVCQLCVKKVDTDNMIYYCSTCDYVNHLHCATDQELWDDTEPNESTSGLDESIDSFPYVILKSQLGKDKIEKPVEIKHFSHEHDLKLIDEQLKNNEKCDVCTWPIYHGPFYTCAQCRFFLHKSCVELPTKKSHPLHRHPLILLPEPPYVDKHFECDACKRHCNGFTYHCDKCRFDLDIQCSLIPDIFNHEGHEHQLILSSASSYDECSSCDDHKGQIFRCADCEFILDFKCATLPRTIKYGPYEQLFKLSYKDEDDYSDKYYCDICEEERNPEHWFYYCADLSFSAHPGCILGRFPYIMCGRTCRNDISGEHLLTLVDKSEDFYRLCDECGSLCCGLTYECVKCVFSVYRWCFHKTTALTRLAD